MWTRLKQLLAPPVFGDENQNRVAKLLNVVLLIILGAAILINIILPLANPNSSYLTSILLLLISIGLLVYTHWGGYRAVQVSSITLSLAIFVMVTFNSWTDGGLRNTATTTYFLLVVIAGLLLGGWGAVIFGVGSILGVFGLWYGETNGLIAVAPRGVEFQDWFKLAVMLGTVIILIRFAINNLTQALVRTHRAVTEAQQAAAAMQQAAAVSQQAAAATQQFNEQLQREITEREHAEQELQEKVEVIQAQQRAITELSTPVIPVMEGIIVLPLVGSIDSLRARDVTRSLLAGITQHRARVVILDITGVPIIDSGVAGHLNKTIQAARLKGAQVIMTGIAEAVAETIVDLGIDWSHITTLSDLQTGLVMALSTMGIALRKA